MIGKLDAYIQIVVLILGFIVSAYFACQKNSEFLFFSGYILVAIFQILSFVFHKFIDNKNETKFLKFYRIYLITTLIFLIPPITIIGLVSLLIISPIVAILCVIFNYHENAKPIFKEDSIRWY
jgi:hypothetical protein